MAYTREQLEGMTRVILRHTAVELGLTNASVSRMQSREVIEWILAKQTGGAVSFFTVSTLKQMTMTQLRRVATEFFNIEIDKDIVITDKKYLIDRILEQGNKATRALLSKVQRRTLEDFYKRETGATVAQARNADASVMIDVLEGTVMSDEVTRELIDNAHGRVSRLELKELQTKLRKIAPGIKVDHAPNFKVAMHFATAHLEISQVEVLMDLLLEKAPWALPTVMSTLSKDERTAVRLLWERGSLTTKEIAEHAEKEESFTFGVTPSRWSGVVASLTRKGAVRRLRSGKYDLLMDPS